MTIHQIANAVVAEADPLAGIIWDRTPVLRPGTDFHEDTLYMTFPAEREEQYTVGKGKNATVKNHTVTRTIILSSTGRWFWYDEETVTAEGFRWPQSGFMQETEERWPKEAMRDFITAKHNGTHKPVEGQPLYIDLRDAYLTYVEYSDNIFYDLLPLYIMGSYIYRLFPSIAYLHFNGTKATGKSQNLKLLKTFGFNCIWASNMSTASLFRSTDGSPGLICLDEAESFEGERGEEIRRLLNAGYKQGEYARRTEAGPDGSWIVRQYDTYTPKALASINPLEPVIQSRCVIVPMQPAIRPIPEFYEKDERWSSIRDRLYRWAMDNAPLLSDTYHKWNDPDGIRFTEAPALQNRQWEVAQLFIILADHIGGLDKARQVIEYFNSYFVEQQEAQEEADRTAQMLKVLPRVFDTKELFLDGTHLRIKDIHDVVAEYLNEDEKEYYRTKATSKHLTSLGFRGRKAQKGGQLVAITEDQVREQFRKRHIEPLPEDIEWLQGTRSYVERRSRAQPAPASLWGHTASDDSGET